MSQNQKHLFHFAPPQILFYTGIDLQNIFYEALSNSKHHEWSSSS